ncbi:hypothetical protein C0Q70_14739 [Pomacea canaliculata]|uniref:Uncharacterized protein n=1 Tax=Pomacea canaliculata TaxID=400727 RepID=A0A2T7NSY7_POMCA|nr:hypothetical protein C0Q70_14739 [Pomacea canaliculata]
MTTRRHRRGLHAGMSGSPPGRGRPRGDPPPFKACPPPNQVADLTRLIIYNTTPVVHSDGIVVVFINLRFMARRRQVDSSLLGVALKGVYSRWVNTEDSNVTRVRHLRFATHGDGRRGWVKVSHALSSVFTLSAPRCLRLGRYKVFQRPL